MITQCTTHIHDIRQHLYYESYDHLQKKHNHNIECRHPSTRNDSLGTWKVITPTTCTIYLPVWPWPLIDLRGEVPAALLISSRNLRLVFDEWHSSSVSMPRLRQLLRWIRGQRRHSSSRLIQRDRGGRGTARDWWRILATNKHRACVFFEIISHVSRRYVTRQCARPWNIYRCRVPKWWSQEDDHLMH